MFQEKSLTIRMPLVGGGDQKVYRWLALLAAFRAWLFLAILLVVFELWAECVISSNVFIYRVQHSIYRCIYRHAVIVGAWADISGDFRGD